MAPDAAPRHPVYHVDDPEPYLQLDKQLCFALFSAARMVVDAYGPILHTIGLDYLQYMAMMVAWEADGITEPLFARRLRLTDEELVPVLDGLVERGFVERVETGGAREVWCTAEGWNVKRQAYTVPNAIRCRLLMPEDEIGEMKNGLEAMMRNIEVTAPRLSGDAPE